MSAIQFQSGGDCSPQPPRRGWRPWRGCGASCSVQLRGLPADCRIPGATVQVGFGSDSSVLPVQYGMCKVTQTTVLGQTLFWQLELFMLKETLLSVTAVILVLKIKLMYAKNSLDGYFELLEMFL